MRSIVVGVIHNSSAMWFTEYAIENGIDVDYLAHCELCHLGEFDCHDDCYESAGDETILVGFHEVETREDAWYHVNSRYYAPDEQAEFSAISSVPYTQIVKSRFVVECARCSPCYPNQGDLDTEGDDYLAYCLPPDIFDTEVDGFDVSRIKEMDGHCARHYAMER